MGNSTKTITTTTNKEKIPSRTLLAFTDGVYVIAQHFGNRQTTIEEIGYDVAPEDIEIVNNEEHYIREGWYELSKVNEEIYKIETEVTHYRDIPIDSERGNTMQIYDEAIFISPSGVECKFKKETEDILKEIGIHEPYYEPLESDTDTDEYGKEIVLKKSIDGKIHTVRMKCDFKQDKYKNLYTIKQIVEIRPADED